MRGLCMRIAVTGASSFIAMPLVNLLRKMGNYIVAVVRNVVFES